jgi:hypothetical protein
MPEWNFRAADNYEERAAELAGRLGITDQMIEAVQVFLRNEYDGSDALLFDAGEWDVRDILIVALSARDEKPPP